MGLIGALALPNAGGHSLPRRDESQAGETSKGEVGDHVPLAAPYTLRATRQALTAFANPFMMTGVAAIGQSHLYCPLVQW